MDKQAFKTATYDKTDALSIFDYSKYLIGESLSSLFGKDVETHCFKGKGGLGQMVEELERLNMFPDNHTIGSTDTRRAFLMGNALVTGIVERIAHSFLNSLNL